MKILGALLIVIACWLLGYDFYVCNLRRKEYTEGLIAGLEFLKTEISFSSTVISDALIKSSEFAGIASDLFKTLGEDVSAKGTTITEALKKCDTLIKKQCCKKAYTVIKDFVLQLGINDVSSQVELIDGAVEKLKICYNEQNAFCEKEGVICKKISVIAGLALSLLLM